MMEVLDNDLGYSNVIVLAIDGNTPRFRDGLYDMLKQMSSIFGETWWEFMMIGVTKWPFDQVYGRMRRDFFLGPKFLVLLTLNPVLFNAEPLAAFVDTLLQSVGTATCCKLQASCPEGIYRSFI